MRVHAFVHGVGTAASLRGVATVLKRHNPEVRIVAVEPAESPVLQGGAPGPHGIEGVGIGYTPPLWDPAVVDEVVAVGSDAAKQMARRLAREEALFAGTPSGANVIAAIEVGTLAGTGRDRRHPAGRLRIEVPEHRRLPRIPRACADTMPAHEAMGRSTPERGSAATVEAT